MYMYLSHRTLYVYVDTASLLAGGQMGLCMCQALSG